MKFVYKQEFELSLKAIFILKIFLKLPNNEIDTSMRCDWLHREVTHNWTEENRIKQICWKRNEEASLDKAFNELRDNELLDCPEVGEGCYFRYVLSDKAKYFINKIKRINTKEFDYLIPENFF